MGSLPSRLNYGHDLQKNNNLFSYFQPKKLPWHESQLRRLKKFPVAEGALPPQ